MKKTFKTFTKKIIAGVMVFIMLFSAVASITKVIAATYGEGNHYMKVGIDNQLGVTITGVTVNNSPWENGNDEFYTNNDQYHIVINVSGNEITGDKIPGIEYGGNWNDYIEMSTQHEGNNYTFVLDVNNAENQEFLGLKIIEGEAWGGTNEPHFDGKAYVLWSCGTGTCYHYFDNIPNFDDGNSTFYKDTEIKADNDESIHFDVSAEYKAWALPNKFNRWVQAYKEQNNVENIDWTQVDPEDIISESPPKMDQWEAVAVAAYENNHETGCRRPGNNAPGDEWDEFENCVDEYYIAAGNLPFIRLQPVGEPEYKNVYVSYGDRNFKVAIYNSDYRGIAMGDLSRLSYYPSEWTNPFIKRDQYDISDTEADDPSPIDSILLESTVIIKPLEYNNFEIKSIEALDVPDDAVTISKDEQKGEYHLVFSSNFYDNVVFKIVGTDNKEYYVLVQRYTVDGYFKMAGSKPVIAAEFYFDRLKNYDDFDLTLKINYKDGTVKTVGMEAIKGIDDGLGNITDAYEVDVEAGDNNVPHGKGLKKSYFEYELEDGEIDTIDTMYINAEYKGSTSTNYAGAYVGSGEGVLVKVYRGE